MPRFHSSVAGIVWPAIASIPGASLLALLFQLEQSQWLLPEILRARQFEQLQALFGYLWQHAAFYRQRLETAGWQPERPLNDEIWQRLAPLARGTVQQQRAELCCQPSPAAHGRLLEFSTTGSLGMPVKGLGNELTHLFNSALILRNHFWQRRDLSAKFAAIRSKATTRNFPNWGIVESAAFATGPSAVLDIASDVDRQLDWLIAEAPAYLLTPPSNLRALLRRARERRVTVGNLCQLATFGEMMDADLRALAQEVWALPLVDVYSSEEFGTIALQCPENPEHYHVQAENLLLEVVDAAGQACAPGEVGRVLISTLHNFSMPLLRYEIGDCAALGPPCTCGRGLPTITRIAGRRRNMITLPDGSRHWPSFPSRPLREVADFRQIQIVQTGRDALEIRLARAQPLDALEERAFGQCLNTLLHGNFRHRFVYSPALAPGTGGKFEDFIGLDDEPKAGAPA